MKRIERIAVALLLACAAAGGVFLLQACSNSILRNAAEAGMESALDDPLPTPTRAAAK
jgi:hypothetical protein